MDYHTHSAPDPMEVTDREKDAIAALADRACALARRADERGAAAEREASAARAALERGADPTAFHERSRAMIAEAFRLRREAHLLAAEASARAAAVVLPRGGPPTWTPAPKPSITQPHAEPPKGRGERARAVTCRR